MRLLDAGCFRSQAIVVDYTCTIVPVDSWYWKRNMYFLALLSFFFPLSHLLFLFFQRMSGEQLRTRIERVRDWQFFSLCLWRNRENEKESLQVMGVVRRISEDLINPLSKDYLYSHHVRKILGREFCRDFLEQYCLVPFKIEDSLIGRYFL